jgi:glycine oxidase
MLVLRSQPGHISHIILKRGHYLIPRQDGRILVGSTVEETGFDRSITDLAHSELRAAAVELAPSLNECPVEHHWAGLRPGSPDGTPFIGEHPNIRGLFVCGGHFRNGIVLAPASARLATDLMLGRPPLFDPTPYQLLRT